MNHALRQVVQMKKGLHEQLKGMEKASSASKHEQELTAKRERAEREKRCVYVCVCVCRCRCVAIRKQPLSLVQPILPN